MRKSKKSEQTAIQAVARHFAATLEVGKGPADACLCIAAKRIALVVTEIESRAARRGRITKPGLRFDRVALGLIARLRAALHEAVPDHETLLVTITAPIRLPAKTAAAMAEQIGSFVATRAAPARLTDRIHGNDIQAHVLKGATTRTSKLIGFVHNPDSEPTILVDVTRALLGGAAARDRSARGSWLVVAGQDSPVPIATYRHVGAQLGLGTVFEKTVIVLPGERIATLSD
jgi:hypothetical protein